MAIVLPISELTDNPDRISKLCHSHNEPIFITKDGYGDMVVMNFDYYQKLKSQADANIARAKLDLSKAVKINDDTTGEKADNDTAPSDEISDAAEEENAEEAAKQAERDIRSVLQRAKNEGGIEKIPLEDVLDIFKNELERQKDMDNNNRRRFP